MAETRGSIQAIASKHTTLLDSPLFQNAEPLSGVQARPPTSNHNRYQSAASHKLVFQREPYRYIPASAPHPFIGLSANGGQPAAGYPHMMPPVVQAM